MSSKREQIIKTAVRLFGAHGYHATGIDRLTEEAQVSKKTLYHHFRTKEELILAALRYQDSLFRNHFMKNVETAAETPYQRLLAVYDVAGEWFADNHFYGCMFINAIGEYSEPNTAIRSICKEFKQLMQAYLEELCNQCDTGKPKQLASELALLLEGAIVKAQVSGNPGSASEAKRVAKVLIDLAISDNTTTH